MEASCVASIRCMLSKQKSACERENVKKEHLCYLVVKLRIRFLPPEWNMYSGYIAIRPIHCIWYVILRLHLKFYSHTWGSGGGTSQLYWFPLQEKVLSLLPSCPVSTSHPVSPVSSPCPHADVKHSLLSFLSFSFFFFSSVRTGSGPEAFTTHVNNPNKMLELWRLSEAFFVSGSLMTSTNQFFLSFFLFSLFLPCVLPFFLWLLFSTFWNGEL